MEKSEKSAVWTEVARDLCYWNSKNTTINVYCNSKEKAIFIVKQAIKNGVKQDLIIN
jgi:hypothetical protein